MSVNTGGDLPPDVRPRDVAFRNKAGTFSASLTLDDEGIIHMKKSGYQEFADVAGEQAMVQQFLADCAWIEQLYLCVDASDFKGQSRLTRKKHAEFVKEMPFVAAVAYGLSLPVRVFASVFARSPVGKPVRIFGTRAEALNFVRIDRVQKGFLAPNLGIVAGFRDYQGFTKNKPNIYHMYPESALTLEYGGQTYEALHRPHWFYSDSNDLFTTRHTLLGGDTVLTQSSGCLTEEVVRETQKFDQMVRKEIGLENLYFIHDSRSVQPVKRKVRTALKLRYESALDGQILVVVVGKPMHVIAMRWLRAVAPSIFKSWIPAPSIVNALEVIDEHRQRCSRGEIDLNYALEPSNNGDISQANDHWIPTDPDALVALVKEQRASLMANDQALDLVIDRLGRLSWDESSAPNFEIANVEPKLELVFGSLQLMHSDIAEIVGELNNRMDELSQSKKQLSMAQRVAHLGSWEWVIPTNSITWSEETFRIYGYEPNAVSVDYSLFLNHQHPDSRSMVEACIRETLENDAPFDHVRRICQLDGSERIVSSRGYLERDEHGQALRMYGTIHDITDVVTARNAEEQAHEEMSAREAALRSTLVDLSHDVRTPLASLKLGIGRLSGLDMKSNLLSSLIAEVEYLDGLFANIMSLVRFKSSTIELRMHPFGVNDVLERVKARLSILALERNISIECAATDEDLQVCGDPLALEQAMGNLVHNGIKFAKGNVAILLDREDDRAVFEVRDDGPGLLDIEIPRLTDRYYQGLDKANRAGRGQGLGLPIAKAIIDEHGGSLKLGRLPAGGTVVTVSLPLAK